MEEKPPVTPGSLTESRARLAARKLWSFSCFHPHHSSTRVSSECTRPRPVFLLGCWEPNSVCHDCAVSLFTQWTLSFVLLSLKPCFWLWVTHLCLEWKSLYHDGKNLAYEQRSRSLQLRLSKGQVTENRQSWQGAWGTQSVSCFSLRLWVGLTLLFPPPWHPSSALPPQEGCSQLTSREATADQALWVLTFCWIKSHKDRTSSLDTC